MIKLTNIDLKFGDNQVFKDFNLGVDKEEKVLLAAPSGKGKSTLFKLLLGFQRCDGGTIELEGKTLNRQHMPHFRNKIGYVSQDVDLRNGKIRDLIREILDYKQNRHIEYSEERLLELAAYFDLPKDLLDKEVRQLSGGERQRLGIIICALLDKDVWLLDEVTSGLDTQMSEKVIDFILGQEKTVLIVSHDEKWKQSDCVRVEEW